MFFYGDSHIMRKPAGDCTLAITTRIQSMASGLARQGGVSTPAGGLDHSGRATSAHRVATLLGVSIQAVWKWVGDGTREIWNHWKNAGAAVGE